MKNKQPAPEPTKSELEILQVLWQAGPSTVRAVHTELEKQRDINYTTTLKLMQIMTDKGLLRRDESQMKHIYSVVEEEQKTKSHLLQKFVDSMYKGSASQLVMQLLGNRKTSSQEIEEIRELLKKFDK
jgi:BlaI family transcriptional regulator, penicillinase repressor